MITAAPRPLVCWLFAVVLAGCVPGDVGLPKPSAAHAIWCTDQKTSEGHYAVSCAAPTRTSIGDIERAALQRAADVTILAGFPLFAINEHHIDRDVFVLETERGEQVVYRGGYKDWRRFWRFYCLGRGLPGCSQDPLWPSNRPPEKFVEVSYRFELLREADARFTAMDARILREGVDLHRRPAGGSHDVPPRRSEKAPSK